MFSQTATNFTCADCSGITYDLFTQLDSGKVVVICWVMPCGSCVAPSVTTYNTVSSYQSTFPGRVLFFLADDFANTNCATLTGWADANNLPESSFSRRFSNAAIDMSDYGNPGMPKVVVLAGLNHQVFFNVNDVISQAPLQSAIDSALAATGTHDITTGRSTVGVYPTVTDRYLYLTLNESRTDLKSIKVFNTQGICLKTISVDNTVLTDPFSIDVTGLAKGMYLISVTAGQNTYNFRFIVN